MTTTLMSDYESIKSFYTSALLATPLDIISLLVQETSNSQNFVVSSSVLECLISATRCIRPFSCSLHYITTTSNSFSLSIFRRTHMISTGMSDITTIVTCCLCSSNQNAHGNLARPSQLTWHDRTLNCRCCRFRVTK